MHGYYIFEAFILFQIIFNTFSNFRLTYPKQSERPYPLLPKDTILAHLLRQSELVYKYHEHDSLLENKVEQELSEQEKADAWDTYERELQMNLGTKIPKQITQKITILICYSLYSSTTRRIKCRKVS